VEPDSHKQLRRIVADRLRTMIAQGELRAGEWLRQERLSRALGMSFTPIREALKQLEAEGLVEHVPYRGVRVVTFSLDDLLDIYGMRSVLEGLAAANAAERITPEQLAELRELDQRMKSLTGPENLAEVRALNQRFHLLIAEASERKYLIRTLNAIWTWFPTMLWSQFLPENSDPPERESEDNAEHGLILGALEARDPEAAREAIQRHIDRARRTLLDFIAQQKPQETASS
jgi:DNA-binding GntR family transcriptional regulator